MERVNRQTPEPGFVNIQYLEYREMLDEHKILHMLLKDDRFWKPTVEAMKTLSREGRFEALRYRYHADRLVEEIEYEKDPIVEAKFIQDSE